MYIRKLIQFCQEILYAFLYEIFTLFADLPKNLMFPFSNSTRFAVAFEICHM